MRRFTSIAVVVWSIALVAMYGRLIAYGSEQGDNGQPPEAWPADASIHHHPDRWNLVLFAHPHCPCTIATMREFERLHSQHHLAFSATLVLFNPNTENPNWVNGELLKLAREIDGLRVVTDTQGAITEQFHIQTSGHLLAYSADGVLRYSGGLTSSRGHEGLSFGTRALSEMLASDQQTARIVLPVFGCPILDAQTGPVCQEAPYGKP